VVEQSLKIVHLYTCINSLVFAGAIVSTFVCNEGANTTIMRLFAPVQLFPLLFAMQEPILLLCVFSRARERVASVSKFGGGDNSVPWLSFAQQKRTRDGKVHCSRVLGFIVVC
jgi:hypothetical protein